MKPRTSREELRKFIGLMNYYSDMWERSSYKLSPLNNITSSKLKFECNKIELDTFDEIRSIVARDTLLVYPDFNEEFIIHINARRL